MRNKVLLFYQIDAIKEGMQQNEDNKKSFITKGKEKEYKFL